MTTTERTPGDQKLGAALGMASLGLGVPMAVAPGPFLRVIGIKPDDKAKRWARAVGAREFAHAAGLLAVERPVPAVSAWTRVAGDTKDLALLLSALRKPADRQRLLAAIGMAGLIGAIDVYAALRLTSAKRRPGTPPNIQEQPIEDRRPKSNKRSITLALPQAEVEARFAELDAEWLENANVTIRRAPGDRGTEIHVELTSGVPGNSLSQAAAKLTNSDAMQQVGDDLRRFKQLVETGVVVRSDGSPDGPETKRLFKQRPAQPVESGGSDS